MKANELMVGNIVRYDGMTVYVGQVNKTKIEGMIDKNDLLVDIRFSVELLEPIPITEEWLAKQGFKREHDCICEYTYYIREIDGYFVEVKIGCSNMGDEYVNCHIDNCDRCTVANADIQYVHQLQNLLNIMNIKFDIKL
jgi:hypothetical protein